MTKKLLRLLYDECSICYCSICGRNAFSGVGVDVPKGGSVFIGVAVSVGVDVGVGVGVSNSGQLNALVWPATCRPPPPESSTRSVKLYVPPHWTA